MKLKTKIVTDKVVGLPVAYLLNVAARILGFLLRIDHSLERPVKKIVVCKFIGMGSIVQSTPLLKTLRKNFPEAKIIFVTNLANRPLFNYIREVDEVMCVSDKGFWALLLSTSRLLFRLWAQRVDVYIDLEIYSNYSSLVTTMSLARNRMGFFKDDKSYRGGMYTHMIFYSIKSPVSQTYLQFARLYRCREIITEVSMDLSFMPKDIMSKIAADLGIVPENYVLINPNASDLRLERRWPSERVSELVKSLKSVYPELMIILIGDRNEAEYVSGIAKDAGVMNSAGKLDLHELIALIAGARLLVTNDTGPMHLAFATGTRTVSLFGPCAPQQYGGRSRTISIYKNVYCSPCVHEFLVPPCKGDNQCMKKINVEEVIDAVRQMLEGQYRPEAVPEPIYLDEGLAPLGVILR
jgi:ADP-heptose:LPS heptosyltransferase